MKPARQTSDGRWFWCGQDAADYALEVGGANGLLVYLGLCRWQARSGGREVFHASGKNLAAATGLGVRTVERYLDLLTNARLVERTSGRGSGLNGAHAANTYRLPAPPSVTAAYGASVTVTHPPYVTDSRVIGRQIEGSLQSKEEPSAADAAPGPVGAGAAGGDEEHRFL